MVAEYYCLQCLYNTRNESQPLSITLKLSVIASTYNSTEWLQKVLWGFAAQTHQDFELLIADDGSDKETAGLLAAASRDLGLEIRHIWQRDEGFRKCRILNKAILKAQSDYIVFTDGDCIPRADFLEVHHNTAKPGYYLSGSYYKLPMVTSHAISHDDIQWGRCFDFLWLRQNGLPPTAKRMKISTGRTLAKLFNRITPTACNLKGSNASVWKKDLLTVGGFDERLQWGGLDRELGVRLKNAGIKPKHVRYDAICVHLDHARGYADPANVAANKAHRIKVQREKISYTEYGTEAISDNQLAAAELQLQDPADTSSPVSSNAQASS